MCNFTSICLIKCFSRNFQKDTIFNSTLIYKYKKLFDLQIKTLQLDFLKISSQLGLSLSFFLYRVKFKNSFWRIKNSNSLNSLNWQVFNSTLVELSGKFKKFSEVGNCSSDFFFKTDKMLFHRMFLSRKMQKSKKNCHSVLSNLAFWKEICFGTRNIHKDKSGKFLQ